jgi:integrase
LLNSDCDTLEELRLTFSKSELTSYTDRREVGLSRKTTNWLRKAAQILWTCTKGEISKTTVDVLRQYVLRKYVDVYAKRKVINFTKAFFRYLAKTRFNTRYQAFELFLEMPKALQKRKHVTSRIVTKRDIENVLAAIEQAAEKEEIDECHRLNYRAIMLFGAFTGQRPLATIARLTVNQFKQALGQDKPVLDIPPECDKIRMQHYCPLHPQVVDAVNLLLDDRDDGKFIFEQLSFERWLRERKILLSQCDARFVMGDLRKFAEQYGDIIQWEQSNRAYILTHGVSGVDWRFYKHPLPDSVYDIYMKYWGGVRLKNLS